MERLASRFPPPPRPARDADRGADRDQQRQPHPARAILEQRLGRVETAVVEVEQIRERHALARVRQSLQHREVPEQDLEQQRDVADDLDVDRGKTRDQPVGREARQPDHEAEDGRQNDADAGDQERVEEPDPEHARVRRQLGVVDQGLRDAEARRLVEEAEAGGDALPFQIDQRVVDDVGAEQDDAGERQDLIGDRAHPRIVPQGRSGGRRAQLLTLRDHGALGLTDGTSRRTARSGSDPLFLTYASLAFRPSAVKPVRITVVGPALCRRSPPCPARRPGELARPDGPWHSRRAGAQASA